MDERSPWLYLSDGGHIENLGVYELLRRRCQYIVAIDGEQDERMTFAALTTLQRLAAIDLGVKIDIDLDDLRLNEQGLSRSHFRFCRIEYPDDQYGYLLYVKLSLTGNEGEFLRRYRLDEPAFPHHSTADQFFTEAQLKPTAASASTSATSSSSGRWWENGSRIRTQSRSKICSASWGHDCSNHSS